MYDPYAAEGLYDLAEKWQRGFKLFCYKFWQAQGERERERRKPVKVHLSGDSEGIYLKVTCADGEWYHVSLEGDWY